MSSIQDTHNCPVELDGADRPSCVPGPHSVIDSAFESEKKRHSALRQEDLMDLARTNQMALSVLGSEPSDDGQFDDDDPDNHSYYEHDEDDDDYESTASELSREPSQRFSRVSSRFSSRSAQYHSAKSSTIQGLDEHQETLSFDDEGLSACGSGTRSPTRSDGRLADYYHHRAAMLRRAATAPAASSQPLPTTKEKDEDDADFEGSLTRLSSMSVLAIGSDPKSPANSSSLPLRDQKETSQAPDERSTDTDSSTECEGQNKSGRHSPSDPEKRAASDSKSLEQETDGQHSPTLHDADLTGDIKTSSVCAVTEKAAAPSEEQQSPSEPEIAHISGLRLVALTASLALAVFVVGMDVNIISIAIPHIVKDFNSLDDIGWYGAAFLMTTCSFQILFGRVYTLLSPKWVFVAALVIFEAGSLIAALSPSSAVLILGRAVQGTGTSGILSGALIIISLNVPLSKRSLLGGIIGSIEGIAMISAPLIGGVFTERATWRWCFWINLPLGGTVLAIVLILLRVPRQAGQQATTQAKETWVAKVVRLARLLDLFGTAMLMATITCTLLALQWGGTKYPWSSPEIITLFILAGVLGAIFAYFQHQKQDLAMLPPRIIRRRSILAGFWYTICTSSAFATMVYFLPIWFQTVRGVSPSESAIHMLPVLLGVVLAVLAAGALVSVIGYYAAMMLAGTVLMSLGAGLLSLLSPSTSNAMLIVYPALFGLGVGMAFQQPVMAAQATLAKEDIPVGTSVIVLGQSMGAAVVISIAETVFANRLASSVGVSVDSNSLSLGGANLGSNTGVSQAQLVDADSKAITQAFYVALAMATLSVFGALAMEWKNLKQVETKKESGGSVESSVESSVVV